MRIERECTVADVLAKPKDGVVPCLVVGWLGGNLCALPGFGFDGVGVDEEEGKSGTGDDGEEVRIAE